MIWDIALTIVIFIVWSIASGVAGGAPIANATAKWGIQALIAIVAVVAILGVWGLIPAGEWHR